MNFPPDVLPLECFSCFELDDMTALFFKQDERLMFLMIPTGSEGDIPAHRRDLNDSLGYLGCRKNGGDSVVAHPDGMIQYYLLHDNLPIHTPMLNGGSVARLKFVRQERRGNVIATVFRDDRGFEVEQTLRHVCGEPYVEINTSVTNHSDCEAELGMLESFMLTFLSPFHADDAPDALKLHRYRSFWSSEGREESPYVEELELSETWAGNYPRGIQFGQRSSWVVRDYFPTLGLEDTTANVTWAVQLGTVSPWQMKVSRNGDFLSMSGGLPDLTFANFRRTLRPGECCTGIPAIMTVVRGDMQNALHRLTSYPVDYAVAHPAAEKDLPLIFNEYCTTFGKPAESRIRPAIDNLASLGIGYFVIDAGWFRNHDTMSPGIGDWDIYEPNYPAGFDTLLDRIRNTGMIPGIWFEFECVSERSELFKTHPDWLIEWEHQLYRPDVDRFFLDFRKPEVIEYLDQRVIGFLKRHRIGYMKVDYNGCFEMADSPNGSLAQGVQEVLTSVRAFYLHLRRELPELVLEICASGGYRLSAEWMRIGDMASFSDSHETIAVPLIAAQTAQQIPFTANQVWATLRTGEQKSRTIYQLASGFLGRLCVSGDAAEFSPFQKQAVRDAAELYKQCTDVIKNGVSRLERHLLGHNYSSPRGYQIFRRTLGKRQLIVVHTFKDVPAAIDIPLAHGRVLHSLAHGLAYQVTAQKISFPQPQEFSAAVLLVEFDPGK